MGQSNESVLVETLRAMDEIRVEGWWHTINSININRKLGSVTISCTIGKRANTSKVVTFPIGTEIAKMVYYSY